MKKWITILSGLLVLQIAVTVGVNLSRENYGAFVPEEKLLSFDAGALNRIRIDGDADQHLVLNKQEGQWRLPELNGFQADQSSVERLLEQLAGLEKGWPVATTTGAAKRFKVAAASFERKVTLSQNGETQATLYVGTSPGFRKVHVRVPDENDVYAVEFSAFEAGVQLEDWLDKAVLTHKADDIRRAELPGFTLQRQDDGLVVQGLAADEETVEDEAKRLLDAIAGLRIRAVLGTEDKPEYRQDEPALRYLLGFETAEAQTYVFSKPTDADYYVLKASHRDEYFKVDTGIVDRLEKVTRDTLVRKPAEDSAATPETPKDKGIKQTEVGG
ncbi:hypothetical protein NKDENANG_02393 [Candidatus Entotheonellaceae bacterium PAL068K]